jgi:hypothetical protein
VTMKPRDDTKQPFIAFEMCQSSSKHVAISRHPIQSRGGNDSGEGR